VSGPAPASPIVLPRALRPGDRIAVVAASGVVDAERLEAGVRLLADRGFEVRVPPSRHPYRCLAASDDERRADLVAAFADPEVRAVWCARGGYGMVRLLPALEPTWLRRHAKLVIGYSDATALLARLVAGAGVAAIHGPMVASDLPRQLAAGAADHVLALAAGECGWTIPIPRAIAAGEAVAPLVGGCLTVLASLAGTPFAPRFAGAIALLEDVGERPQRRIDRMLLQLRQSGMLDGVRGFVFGTMPDCGDPDDLCQTIRDALGDLDVPIGFGAPLGHGEVNLAVPLGVRVRLRVASAAPDGDAPGVLAGVEPVVA
jgi:muramoyltetrapeptide carboxypeptidase